MNILLCLDNLCLLFVFKTWCDNQFCKRDDRTNNRSNFESIECFVWINFSYRIEEVRPTTSLRFSQSANQWYPPATAVGYNIWYDIIGDSSSTTQSIMIKYLGYIIVILTLEVHFRVRPLPFSGPALSFFFFRELPDFFFRGPDSAIFLELQSRALPNPHAGAHGGWDPSGASV